MLYQIYLRSFADGNGDGVGDLEGAIRRLDHLAWLGIDAVWLSPLGPSPNEDWGYDVADYLAVDPELGTPADVDRFIAAAGERGIRVLCDLVPNHTSEKHAWFVESRSSLQSGKRDWYVWADPAPGGGPPNNWVSNFGGPAWTLDDATGQYYLHGFLPGQPDLNWWNADVRDAFDDIMRFWFDRGVAGFRIDVCHMIVKDRELRDNPPAEDGDHFEDRLRGQRQIFNANRPEVHDVLRRFRRVADSCEPERLLLGETYMFDLTEVATYYGEGDELHLAFNFPFLFARFETERLHPLVESVDRLLGDVGWPVWTGSNHDAGRFPSRWAAGNEDAARCALMMLLTLRGTPVLYYGDEIGMPDTPLQREDVLDPVGVRFWPAYHGRDPGRTPMHWSSRAGAGFTEDGVRPWLPFGDHASCNVEDQQADPGSVLHLCRDLIHLRRDSDDLRLGAYTPIRSADGLWVFSRGGATVVALNLSDATAELPDVRGSVAICTRRDRDGSRVTGTLELRGWEGIVVVEG